MPHIIRYHIAWFSRKKNSRTEASNKCRHRIWFTMLFRKPVHATDWSPTLVHQATDNALLMDRNTGTSFCCLYHFFSPIQTALSAAVEYTIFIEQLARAHCLALPKKIRAIEIVWLTIYIGQWFFFGWTNAFRHDIKHFHWEIVAFLFIRSLVQMDKNIHIELRNRNRTKKIVPQKLKNEK